MKMQAESTAHMDCHEIIMGGFSLLWQHNSDNNRKVGGVWGKGMDVQRKALYHIRAHHHATHCGRVCGLCNM